MIILTITDDNKAQIIAGGSIAKCAEEQAKKMGVSVEEVLEKGLIRFLINSTTTKKERKD